MHLRAGNVCAARLGMTLDVADFDDARRPPDLAEPLRELARGPAWRIGLARLRVVDDLPSVEVARCFDCRSQQERSRQ